MSIKCILFDFDGVLCDLSEMHKIVLNKALKQVANIEISDQQHLDKFNGLSTKKKLDILQQDGLLNNNQISKISQLKQIFTLEELNKVRPDSERTKIFKYLCDRDVIIGVVSNAKRETIFTGLKNMELLDQTSFFLGNEDCSNNKPYPDPYVLATNRTYLSQNEIVVIEDNDYGVKSAIEAGLRVEKINNFADLTLDFIKNIVEL